MYNIYIIYNIIDIYIYNIQNLWKYLNNIKKKKNGQRNFLSEKEKSPFFHKNLDKYKTV